jgi:hypothetical protein
MVPKDDTSPPIGKRYEQSISIQRAQDVGLPTGKRYEQPISIQRAQDVSLMGSVSRLLARTVARVVAPLRRGRPREYDHGALTGVAEDCAMTVVEDYLDRFVERVRHECKLRHIKAPKDTVLTDICKLVFLRAKGAGK